MEDLYKKLMAYGETDAYPFHMPGHKRKNMGDMNPYHIDITEIDGFDNMNDPNEIIRDLMERLGKLYGRQYAYLLVNGSTAGNLSSVFATTSQGDSVLVARDSHKSVYNATFLRQLHVDYLYPNMEGRPYAGPVKPEDVEAALDRNPEIKAVVITSPSYEGIVSPVDEVARVCHRYHAALIVDAAHGAHFGMHPELPELPEEADLIVMSLHKTLPSFTSTGVVLWKEDGLVKREQLEEYLHIFQTSSPSYILMAGISRCVSFLETEGREYFQKYVDNMKEFYNACGNLKHLELLQEGGQDLSKVVIYAKPESTLDGKQLTGEMIMEFIRKEHHLELEMAQFNYALAMTSIMDEAEDLKRLELALKDLDTRCQEMSTEGVSLKDLDALVSHIMKPKEKVMEIYEARALPSEEVALHDAENRVSAAMISLYPPGIPVVVPGERIDRETISYLEDAMKIGLTVNGLENHGKNLKVC